MKFKFNLILTVITASALALTSCGANNASIIATSVASTVQAQNTQSASVTDTPLALAATSSPASTPTTGTLAAGTPAAPSTLTPFITSQAVATNSSQCTAAATFVSETIPDGTIEGPGATFTKTWNIQNTGTCPWDSTWKFVYVSGDLMGAAISYPLTYTAPNQTLNFSVVLTAPVVEGGYRGYWEIVSQWGAPVRDSGSGNPFWVDINVNSGTPGSGTPTVYGITSVSYSYGTTNKQNQQAIPGVNAGYCTGGANIFLTTFATISASGPLTVTYYFQHSDGPHSPPQTLTFTSATSKTVSDTWPILVRSNDGSYWEAIVVTSPVHTNYPNTYAVFDKQCQ
ncbi:MAG TPA: NBR1-Ig-like domain-containing protein [Anaerolineales bacterium]